MGTEYTLKSTLRRIDGRGYKAYQEIKGEYDFGEFELRVDHVQGDPFASPSRLSLRLQLSMAGFPPGLLSNSLRRTATGDFLARRVRSAIEQIARQKRGTGHSGQIFIDAGGQEVLERNCVVWTRDLLEVRFYAGLPAAGRRVLAREADEMLFDEIPRIAKASLYYRSLSSDQLRKHVEVVEDQQSLRKQLAENGLIAFVGNGALLPRRSGVDERPLQATRNQVLVPFESPLELKTTLQRPNSGPIDGMAIPRGVTLIVGGGYHGKSTLLNAIERGIYNQVPGDGREWVITVENAVKIRAEDGRFVEQVDISPFIDNLPYGRDTTRFSTENASGSTSQAANIVEALEIGSKLLLIDEDTSATNFIIRDARMQALVEKSKEPITPFVDRVRQLFLEHETSTILVMGGSGDYFDVADHVIMLDEYRPQWVTDRAKKITCAYPTRRKPERTGLFAPCLNRNPVAGSFDASRGKRETKVDAKGLRTILFGVHAIDLTAVDQLVDPSQTRAIANALVYYSRRYASRGYTLREGLRALEEDLAKEGLDILSPFKVGNLARPRMHEVAAAINRLRTLEVKTPAR